MERACCRKERVERNGGVGFRGFGADMLQRAGEHSARRNAAVAAWLGRCVRKVCFWMGCAQVGRMKRRECNHLDILPARIVGHAVVDVVPARWDLHVTMGGWKLACRSRRT